MTILGADVEPAVLIVTLLGLTLHAWYRASQTSKTFRELATWVRDKYPERWQVLPWSTRHILSRSAIIRLQREGMDQEPEFAARLKAAKSAQRRSGIALLAAELCIPVLLLGIKFLGWRL